MTRFGTLLTLATLLVAAPAVAGSGDGAAQAKIDEAINVHYLDTNFAKAEKTLKAAVGGCADKCSPTVLGRAWMYIGIIRAVGLQDNSGASQAFASAFAADPNAKLDADLATPDVKQLFEAARSSGGGGADAEEPEEAPAPKPRAQADDAPGTLVCTPDVTQMETRRPLPVSCIGDEEVAHAILHYKVPGASKWEQLSLSLKDDQWQGQIPCGKTGTTGKLKWYVVANDEGGQKINSFTSKSSPMEIGLVQTTSEAPPSFPDQEPPVRCMDLADCPDEMRGTPSCPGSTPAGAGASWGAKCSKQSECGDGLACIGGTCSTPLSCETDAECGGGSCQNGTCAYSEDGGAAGAKVSNMLSLSIGFDLAQVSGNNVCVPTNKEFACYYADQGKDVRYNLGSNAPAKLGSTLVPATLRIQLGYERLFTDNIGAEARVGWALFTNPNTKTIGALHLELRGKYWFVGADRSGFKPYAAIGAGLGQVDVNIPATIKEVNNGGGSAYAQPADTTLAPFCDNASFPGGSCDFKVRAYRSLGGAFASAAVGAALNFGKVGINAEVKAKFMFPVSALVLEPNVGLNLGF